MNGFSSIRWNILVKLSKIQLMRTVSSFVFVFKKSFCILSMVIAVFLSSQLFYVNYIPLESFCYVHGQRPWFLDFRAQSGGLYCWKYTYGLLPIGLSCRLVINHILVFPGLIMPKRTWWLMGNIRYQPIQYIPTHRMQQKLDQVHQYIHRFYMEYYHMCH